MKPPTLQEVEAYVKEKGLHVDPQFFMDYFEASGWIDSRGNKVKVWKLKLLTWHRAKLERGKVYKCFCGKPGVYIVGNDAVGFPVRRCIDHKPVPKPLPADHPANTIKFKTVDNPKVDVNNERNRNLDKLKPYIR